jgi:hypothetical protein
MPDAAQDPGSVFRLMYRSHSLIPAGGRKAELGLLFTQARSQNKARGLTGALLVSDDWFVQVLEGEEQTVRALFARIERDDRHDSVTLLQGDHVGPRVFARWAMAEVADDEGGDVPLIAHADGISPAAGRGTTPEQDDILRVMRTAVRSAPQAV